MKKKDATGYKTNQHWNNVACVDCVPTVLPAELFETHSYLSNRLGSHTINNDRL